MSVIGSNYIDINTPCDSFGSYTKLCFCNFVIAIHAQRLHTIHTKAAHKIVQGCKLWAKFATTNDKHGNKTYLFLLYSLNRQERACAFARTIVKLSCSPPTIVKTLEAPLAPLSKPSSLHSHNCQNPHSSAQTIVTNSYGFGQRPFVNNSAKS